MDRRLGSGREVIVVEMEKKSRSTTCGVTQNLTVPYFAYGSNINLAHLRWYLALHGLDHHDHVTEVRHAVLPNCRLRTNYMTWDGSGACNIEPCRGRAVEGLVMTISEQVHTVLRVKEGFPHCYDETQVEVVVEANTLTAMTYIVTPERQLPMNVPVSPQYRQLILHGARKASFSQRYQQRLRQLLNPIHLCEHKRSSCG